MTRRMKNAPLRFLLALCSTALLFSAPVLAEERAAPDITAGPATIHGRVIAKEDPTLGIAGAKIVLYALLSNGSPGLRNATSDADGRFRFEAISNSPDIVY